jgi:alkanesulfonate monooxygenase SsuD/methylene tetrahydromethanopterin reductase-like flavin-dependent oxidoreductase (luciferase family)
MATRPERHRALEGVRVMGAEPDGRVGLLHGLRLHGHLIKRAEELGFHRAWFYDTLLLTCS